MTELKKLEAELNLMKRGLNTYFNSNGTPKIDYGEIVEMQELVRAKDLEVYKLREWAKITNKAEGSKWKL